MGLRPGHSAVGSASALGAEGREFESRCPDQFFFHCHTVTQHVILLILSTLSFVLLISCFGQKGHVLT